MKISGFKDTIDWYDNNADTYSKDTKSKTFDDNAKLFIQKVALDAPQILDVGCGDGRDAETLSRLGAKVVGVDVSKGLIEVAKKLHPEIEFKVGNFLELPFPDKSFDGVWSHASLVHLESMTDVKKSLSEFYRVLRSGGWIYVYTKEQLGESETEVISDDLSNHDRFFRYYTRVQLNDLLEAAGFSVDEIMTEEDVHGRAEVSWIRLLAEKR